MNRRGQAAVTDALYFLMVVTFLAVFLFGFANSYGNSVRQQINDEFNVTFATNALKTILYSSTPREAGATLDSDAEVDYLMAILKEDYADDSMMTPASKKVLGSTISSILSPIEDSLDYVFLITTVSETGRELVFMYIHTTNFKRDDIDIPGRGFAVYSAGDPTHYNYFCETQPGENFTGFFESALRRLFANIGPTSEATSPLRLVKINSDATLSNVDAQVDLVMWEATWLGSSPEKPGSGLFYDDDPSVPVSGWANGCVRADELE